MPQRRSATRADVARKAGVSKTTVTFVLNGRQNVAIPDGTRQRVLSAAQELGYRPHPAALALATGRTNVVTAILPNVATPYFAAIADALLDNAYARGFSLVLSKSEYLSKKSSLYWSVTALSDAVIVVGGFDVTQALFQSVNALAAPVISVGVGTPGETDFVELDLRGGAREMMEHLLSPAPRRLAYLYPAMGKTALEHVDGRILAYRDAMAQAGKPTEFIASPTERRDDAAEAVGIHLARHGCPDTLFCYNDDMAIGAYRALSECGRRIGTDICVAGYDGIDEGKYLDPPLSTVVQPIGAMCERTWQFLEERLHEPERPLQHVVLTPQVALRRSTRYC